MHLDVRASGPSNPIRAHQCRAQFSDDLDDCDNEDLCGVGIVFYKAPDNSLFVKVACQRGAGA